MAYGKELNDVVKDPRFAKLSKEDQREMIEMLLDAGKDPSESKASLALQGLGIALDSPADLGRKVAKNLGGGETAQAVGGLGGDILAGVALEAIPIPGVAQAAGATRLAKAGRTVSGLVKSGAIPFAQSWAKHAKEGDVEVNKGDVIGAGLGVGGSVLGHGVSKGAKKYLKTSGIPGKTADRIEDLGGAKFAQEAANLQESAAGRLSEEISDELTEAVRRSQQEAGDKFRKALKSAPNASARGVEGVMKAELKKLGVQIDNVAIDPVKGTASVTLGKIPGAGKLTPEDLVSIKSGMENLYESMYKSFDPKTGWKNTRISAETIDTLKENIAGISKHNNMRKSLSRMQGGEVNATKASQADVQKKAGWALEYGSEPPVDSLLDKSPESLSAKVNNKARMMRNPEIAQRTQKTVTDLAKALNMPGFSGKMNELADALRFARIYGSENLLKLGSASQVVTDIGAISALQAALPTEGWRKLYPILSRALAGKAGEMSQEK